LCPGAVPLRPGAVSLELAGLLRSADGVSVRLGGLVLWPGALPLRPGEVIEAPGVLPERPGELSAWRGAVACLLRAREISLRTLAFLLFFTCCPLFPRDAAALVAEAAGQGPVVSRWRIWAGSAFCETVIVTNGFFCECV
jgi:hypothetical protein